MEKLPTHVTKFSVTLHSQNCFGCSCCWLLVLNQPALIYPALHSPTERLQVTQQGNLLYGLDNYLHKLEEISRKRNPAQGSVQEAYFRKSAHGHLVAKTGEEVKGQRNKKRQMKVENRKMTNKAGVWCFLTSCVWIVEVGVQAFVQEPCQLLNTPLLHILHKLLQICLMEADKRKGRRG